MKKYQIHGPILFETIDYLNSYDFSLIHRHSYFEIMLFENSSQEGINSIDFVDYPIEAKSLHIIAPNQSHLMHRKEKDNGIIIQFTKEFLVQNHHGFHPEWLFSLQSNPVTNLNHGQFTLLLDLMQKMGKLIHKKSKLNALITQHFFYYLIFQILEILQSNAISKVSAPSIEFIGLVEKQFKTNRIVASYAEQMSSPIKKLNIEIKKSLGMTPLQYIHKQLSIEIKRLVKIEEYSHKEIAYELNFDSPASYSRFVKKHFNCKPTELSAV